MRRTILIGVSLLLFWAAVRADDLKLKDGSKISGSIVGFDDNSFKVQTSYGFAVVRKDQVVSITVADSAKAIAKKPDATASEAASSAKEKASAPAASDASSEKPKTLASATPGPSAPEKSTASAAPAAPPAALPPIREKVDGSTYINETYRFRMYKPPDWKVIEGARTIMPGAIAAMGTDDQTTYLLIGEAPAGKSITSDINATDQRLRNVMDNFRPLGETHMNVSGRQAVERRFRGSVDQKDWSGTVVFVSHDGELYTIFGMTIAESDLVQIQENVIARTISSLQFAQ
ncbi:MAG TPA: hypothetical protein VJN69_15430 [Candidatus Acidoferrales bacterium]|nr:hypothetical protein [Candidatus Acidoferrales bacterium]